MNDTWLIWLFNALFYVLCLTKRILARCNLDLVLSDVCSATGLKYFGDTFFMKHYRCLLSEIPETLNTFGCCVVLNASKRCMVNRLLKTEQIRQSPEILNVDIKRPLFVIGLQRTGTTFLHTLFSLDPRVRAPRKWELQTPCPPPEAATYASDPRIASTLRKETIGKWLLPSMEAIHPFRANGPDECLMAMSMDVELAFSLALIGLENTQQLVLEQDLTPVYENYRSTLQLLTWKAPAASHLALKCTLHGLSLPALLESFPDANIVWIHRDLDRSVSSYASVVQALGALALNPPTPHEAGQFSLRIQREIACRAARARGSNPHIHGRIVDVMYEDLVADPVGLVSAVYSKLGYSVSEGWQDAMLKWLVEDAAERQGARAPQPHALRDFGLETHQLEESFGEYQEMRRGAAGGRMNVVRPQSRGC